MSYLEEFNSWKETHLNEGNFSFEDVYNGNNSTAVEEYLVDSYNITTHRDWESELRSKSPKTPEGQRILGFLENRIFPQLKLGATLEDKIQTTVELATELSKKIKGGPLENGGRGIGTPLVSDFWSYLIKKENGTINTTPKTDIYNKSMQFSVKAPKAQLMSASRAESIATVHAAFAYPVVKNVLKKPFEQQVIKTISGMEEKMRIIGDGVDSIESAIEVGHAKRATKEQKAVAAQLENLREMNKDIEIKLKEFVANSSEFRAAFIVESASGKVKFLGTPDKPFKGNVMCVASHVLVWRYDMVGKNQKIRIEKITPEEIEKAIKKIDFSVRFKSHSIKKVVDGEKKIIGFTPYPSLRINIVSQIENKLQEGIELFDEYNSLCEEYGNRIDEAGILDILKSGWSKLKDFVSNIIKFLKEEVLKPAMEMLSKGIHAFMAWLGVEIDNVSFNMEISEY